MKSVKWVVIAWMLGTSAGCGVLANSMVSDDDLARKAAFALNTTQNQVVITERKVETSLLGSSTIHFVATAKGSSHQCYVTTVAGAATSDALCSGSNSVVDGDAAVGSGSCNDLLRAAGRCR